jgi:TPR repeat protein
MATHEELTLIRDARLGKTAAQLDLGARYLNGSAALPKNLEAAMHWLGCAAQQGSIEACTLIAQHIPLDCALAAHDATTLAVWFEQAFDAGITEAGLLFAKLVLQERDVEAAADLQERALAALHTAAHCGSHEAQWLWAGQLRRRGGCESTALAWETRAAQRGLETARLALAEQAWAQGDHDNFLAWALPPARAARNTAVDKGPGALSPGQVRALARCAETLASRPASCERDIRTFWECAAACGDVRAQLQLGLWLAGMRADCEPSLHGPALPDYDMAAQWLVMAGRQGATDAWYALSRLYGSARHARPNAKLQRHYRHKAAELGHRRAQYECGIHAWGGGEGRASSMMRALYWLELASAQGCTASGEMLRKIRQSDPGRLCKTLIASDADREPLLTA